MKRALLIVNQYASAVTPRRVERVSEILRAQADLGTVLTRAPGHATELAEQAVVAIPPPVAVEGNDEHVGALE